MSDRSDDSDGARDGEASGRTDRVANGIRGSYDETATERRLTCEGEGTDGESDTTGASGGSTGTIAQNREGYAMLAVRTGPDGQELERYYGFDMALDHAAERLGVAPAALPVPEPAADMGM